MDSIKTLIERGKYEHATSKINKLLIEKTSKFVDLKILQIIINNKLGKFKDALKLQDKLLTDEFETIQDDKKIQILIEKSTTNWRLGRLDIAFEILSKASKLVEQQKNVEGTNYEEMEALILKLRGAINIQKGNRDIAFEELSKGLQIAIEINNKLLEAAITNNLAIIYASRGELNEALTLYEKSIEIKKDFGNTQDIANSLNNIGNLYRERGDISEAMEYYHQSLDYYREVGNKQYIAYSYNNIGIVNSQIGDKEKAIEYLRYGLQLRTEVGNSIEIATTLFSLIKVLVPTSIEDRLKQANKYYNQLISLSNSMDSKLVNLYRQMSEGLILKNKSNFKNLSEAGKIFTDVINKENIENETTILAITNLCEVLIYEYKLSQDEEILNQISEYTDKVREIAKNINSYYLDIKTLVLASKIALVQLDLKLAEKLIIQAKELAEKRKLNRLLNFINSEQEKLYEEVEKWNLFNKNTKLIGELKKEHLIEYLNSLKDITDYF